MKSLQRVFLFGSSAGMGVTGALVAAGALGAALYGLTYVVQNSSKGGKKTRVVSAQLALESSLLAGLQNPDNYTDVKTQLEAGTVPAGWAIKDNSGLEVAKQGAMKFFDLDGRPCPAFDHKSCVIKTEFDARCASIGVCSAAYRISVDTVSANAGTGPAATIQVVNLGARGSGVFTPPDFFTPLPAEFYMKPMLASCDTSSPNSLFITGLNRTTGELTCVNRPSLLCNSDPQKKLAKEVVYNSVSQSMEVRCAQTKKADCPYLYAPLRFSPKGLDDPVSESGQCVFVAKDSVPMQFPDSSKGAAVAGNFCPKHYKMTGVSCAVVDIVQHTGQCLPDPTIYHPVDPGKSSFTQSGDHHVECHIDVGVQMCGAYWTGNVVLSGTCTLEEAQTLPATFTL